MAACDGDPMCSGYPLTFSHVVYAVFSVVLQGRDDEALLQGRDDEALEIISRLHNETINDQ
jgi:hypothetical protein